MVIRFKKSLGAPAPNRTITLVLEDGRVVETSPIVAVQKHSDTHGISVLINTVDGNIYSAVNPVVLRDPRTSPEKRRFVDFSEVVKPLEVGKKALLVLPDGHIVQTSPVIYFAGDASKLEVYTKNSVYILHWKGGD